ncbi:hypothetical protein [Diaminobutyricimonas sp. LJ205]|uniref:hypothetical protein n=1 Tax=Diaminobutyricimonas sp. LJ205 TaxID=2683590 RepID=UPI0012F51641|nr:hypothetical protein [Diaminobutyricimonas sp. LJ205]
MDRIDCPLHWCNGDPDTHDKEKPLIGQHVHHLIDGLGFGQVGVAQTGISEQKGVPMLLPATIRIDLDTDLLLVPRDARILAKALETAALMAEGITAGDWDETNAVRTK